MDRMGDDLFCPLFIDTMLNHNGLFFKNVMCKQGLIIYKRLTCDRIETVQLPVSLSVVPPFPFIFVVITIMSVPQYFAILFST